MRFTVSGWYAVACDLPATPLLTDWACRRGRRFSGSRRAGCAAPGLRAACPPSSHSPRRSGLARESARRWYRVVRATAGRTSTRSLIGRSSHAGDVDATVARDRSRDSRGLRGAAGAGWLLPAHTGRQAALERRRAGTARGRRCSRERRTGRWRGFVAGARDERQSTTLMRASRAPDASRVCAPRGEIRVGGPKSVSRHACAA